MNTGRKAQGALFCSLLATSIWLANSAIAQEVPSAHPRQALDDTFSAPNPNLDDWTLIKLSPFDVTSALDGLGTKVAVLDGKADCGHVALTGRCANYGLSGGTYVNYDAHGTHVSGIVGANPYGVAPRATVLSYGVFADSGWVATGTQLSDTWKAALGAGAHIANMSFGCSGTALCFTASDLSTMASTSMPMLFVKAAGNDGSTLTNESTSASIATAIAALNKTLIVGSVNAAGAISSFSNRPSDTCLLAGGASNCSEDFRWRNHFLVAPGEAIFSTTPNGTYGAWSGTSMATPVVAGVAALLQTRWPALKNSPETLAKILLTSATDLGDPGVDNVYGFGLLNAERAFAASGTVTIVPPTTTTPPPPTGDGATTTTKTKGNRRKSISTNSFTGFAAAIGSVTVYDLFGRDFRYDESGQLDVRSSVTERRGMRSRRLLGAFTQDSWAPAFFADKPAARSFSAFGSAAAVPGVEAPYDQSLRAGVDMPLGKAAVQLRLSGSNDLRTDFSYDASLRPLAFFHSTNLASNSFISNVLLPAGNKARFMIYGLTSFKPVEMQFDENTRHSVHGRHVAALRTQRSDQSSRSQTGVGVGYWRQAGSRTVVGVNASAMTQRNGFLDLTSDLEAFQRPTHLFNLGFAVSHARGKWDLMASTEFTHARMSASDSGIGVTPTTMASAEVSLARRGIIASGGEASDSLRAAIVIPPRALAGSLKLDYMTPTADGMDRQATIRRIAISTLGHEPARFESAYQISAGDRWSLNLTGAVDLEKVNGSRSAEGLVTFRTSL